jgi:hypothetical protein
MLSNNKLRWIPAVLLILVCASSAALAGERWLHVRVQEEGSRGENVNVNIPLSMVEALLPMIQTDDFNGGRISFGQGDLEGIDLRAALEAIQDAPDAEFVTVKSDDETVRVAKEGNFLLVRVEDLGSREQVRVRMPLDVVDAMLGQGGNEIDILAGLRQLSKFDGDLITVDSDDTTVRVWIDNSDSGD